MAEPNKPSIADDVEAMYAEFSQGKNRLLKWLSDQPNSDELLAAYIDAYNESPEDTLARVKRTKGTEAHPKAKPIARRKRSPSFDVEFRRQTKKDASFLDVVEDGTLTPAMAKKVVPGLCAMLDDPKFSTMVHGVLTDHVKGGMGGGYEVRYSALREAMKAYIRKHYVKDTGRMNALLAKIPRAGRPLDNPSSWAGDRSLSRG